MASSSTQKGTISPFPLLVATPMCGTKREISISCIDVGQAKSGLERGSATLLLDAADSIPKGDERSDLEDGVKAGTTRDDDSSFDKKSEWAKTASRGIQFVDLYSGTRKNAG